MSRLSSAERAEFIQAMADEWQKWSEFRATKSRTEQQVKMFVESGTQIVGTHWVLTWKDSAHSIAKARLVVQGFQEARICIRSDTPTGSRDAFQTTIDHGAQTGCLLRGFDTQSAYLQPGESAR